MKRLLLAILVLQFCPSCTQENLLEDLNKETMALFQYGRYSDAASSAKKALEASEKKFGVDNPEVIESLDNLALIYRAQGKYNEAEPLYRRSLAILEKAYGPDHPDVAMGLNNIAELYTNYQKYSEAEALYERSLGILEKAYGPDHPNLAETLNSYYLLYRYHPGIKGEEELRKRLLAIVERAPGSDHSDQDDDGLSITIGLPYKTYPEDKRFLLLDSPNQAINVILTNHTTKPFRLFESWNSWGAFNLFFEVFDENNNFLYRIEMDRNRVIFTKNSPTTILLYPGDSYILGVNWAASSWILPFNKGPDLYELRMRAVYRSEADPKRPQSNLWTGTVKSEILPYTIRYFREKEQDYK